MTKISFCKYHANGNDFLLINHPINELSMNWLIRKTPFLCDRHKGIGADGIIVLYKDISCYKIFVINQDGSLAKNCGNGLRCVAQHIFLHEKISSVKIILNERIYEANISNDNINITMGICHVTYQHDIYFAKAKVKAKIAKADLGNQHFIILLPHKVLFTDILEELKDYIEINEWNIGFLYQDKNNHFHSLVYERGVGFTKSCGSGAIAASSFLVFLQQEKKPMTIKIYQPGGEIDINVIAEKIDENIGSFIVTQCGKASLVFAGTFKANDIC